MLKIYFYDFETKLQVSIHEPLDASLSQALDIFNDVSKDSNSHFGLLSSQGHTVQFSKYNKFVWLVKIPHHGKKGKYQIFLTPAKVESLIKDLFDGFNPLKINGLMFEKNN